MKRKCRSCMCKKCIKSCSCQGCSKAVKECREFTGFFQPSIFDICSVEKENQEKSGSDGQFEHAPRHSWSYYGIGKERYRELEQLIRSEKYASVALSAAHTANKNISWYILLSVKEKLSYDALNAKWDIGEMERIPYGRSDFYGIRRYFMSIFDRKMKEIGK